MGEVAVVILHLAAIGFIAIGFGVRSGCKVDALRASWKEMVVNAAMCAGVYTICFVMMIFLYMSYVRFNVSAYSAPRPLIPTLRDGFISGFGVAVLTSIPVGIVAVIARRVTIWRMGDRVKSGHCYGCGYDLTGNVSGRCPECGRAVSAANAT